MCRTGVAGGQELVVARVDDVRGVEVVGGVRRLAVARRDAARLAGHDVAPLVVGQDHDVAELVTDRGLEALVVVVVGPDALAVDRAFRSDCRTSTM